MANGLPRYNFDWTQLETIQIWMRQGAGYEAVGRSAQALKDLADQLDDSQARVRDTLTAIGVGWRGSAGDAAGVSTRTVNSWGEQAVPQVARGGDITTDFGAQAEEMRSRMPTLAEVAPTPDELLAERMPIAGGLLSRQAADIRRMIVMQEARDRLNAWQETVHAMYSGVPRLSPVPKVTVNAAPPPEDEPTVIGDQPPGTRDSGQRPSVPVSPTSPADPPGSQPPVVPTPIPPAPAPTPPSAPGTPSIPVSPPRVELPPVPPGAPAAPGSPGTPGVPVAPLPGGPGRGPGGSPGVQQPGLGGQRLGQPGRGPAPGAPGGHPAANPAAIRAAGSAGAAGTGGRGTGGIMQPAAGRGSGGDEDKEHKSKYGLVSDEYFTQGIERVAPPVIGQHTDR